MKMFTICRNGIVVFISPSLETAEAVVKYNTENDPTNDWFHSEVEYLPHNPVSTTLPWAVDHVDALPRRVAISPETYKNCDKLIPLDGKHTFVTWRATAKGAKNAFDSNLNKARK